VSMLASYDDPPARPSALHLALVTLACSAAV
jgi:hypothetical protein